jgi:hypothetical protein
LITIKVTEKIHVFRGKNRKKYGVFLGEILYGRSGLPTGRTVEILYLVDRIYYGVLTDPFR